MLRLTKLILPVVATALLVGCGESIRHPRLGPADDGTAFHALDGNGHDVMPMPSVRETGHHAGFEDNVHPVFQQAEVVQVWVYPQYNEEKAVWISGHDVLFKYTDSAFVVDKRKPSSIPAGPALIEMPKQSREPAKPKSPSSARNTKATKPKPQPVGNTPPVNLGMDQDQINKFINQRVKAVQDTLGLGGNTK